MPNSFNVVVLSACSVFKYVMASLEDWVLPGVIVTTVSLTPIPSVVAKSPVMYAPLLLSK